MEALNNSSQSLTIDQEYEGAKHLTAIASTTNEAIAVALSGLLTIYRDETVESKEETTTALAFRAEGNDLAAMVRRLGEALIEDVDHEAYDVRAVQFNGHVRTETGFSGWGFALAMEGGHERPPLSIAKTEVEARLHQTTVTMSVHRND